MKCVCYEHKISRLRYHLVDIISVSFDKLAIGDAVLNETNVGQVQEIAVDINRGDVPRKPGERARRLASLAGEPRTMVFFESPRRLARTLADMAAAFGPGRPAVVCRELTKTHEEIVRGTLADLAGWAGGKVLGEITVVVGGARDDRRVSGAGPAQGEAAGPAGQMAAGRAAELVAAAELAGLTRKEAIAQAAAELGLAKREVYDAVVRAKSRS